MTKRQKINILLSCLALLTLELWQIWKRPAFDHYDVNWFLAVNYPMNIQWYFHDLGTEVTLFLLSLINFRSARLETPWRLTARIVMYVMAVRVVFFFVNYNRFSYLLVYASVALLTLLYSFYKDDLHLFFKRCRANLLLKWKWRTKRYHLRREQRRLKKAIHHAIKKQNLYDVRGTLIGSHALHEEKGSKAKAVANL